MTIPRPLRRDLGTMIVHGYPRGDLAVDLGLALRLGASVLEVLPNWRAFPDASIVRDRAADLGLRIHSVHGCWGGQAIRAYAVDLSAPDTRLRRESVDDLRRCVDWIADAGGTCLVVHPGGLSDRDEAEMRRGVLSESLVELADHARPVGVVLCVENMPPGVHPGSRMADLRTLVDALDRPEIALAVDTGHANIGASAESETLAAGTRLRTTHVHDNNGRSDTHLPPGQGTVDWAAWRRSLDAIGYRGPVMLECIRHVRSNPDCIDEALIERLALLTEGNGD